MASLKILGITGSLRPGSFNTALLRAASRFLPEGVEMGIRGVGDLPLYEAALDSDEKPATVAALRSHIEEADGLLIATPEYNYSVRRLERYVDGFITWVRNHPRSSN